MPQALHLRVVVGAADCFVSIKSYGGANIRIETMKVRLDKAFP
jgi:hypothetical protein